MTKRRVFFSFKYEDVWKTNTIRNSDMLAKINCEGSFIDSVDREKIKKQTEAKIKKWINEQLNGTSVTCVLVGENTHESKWVKYEIQESIEKQNGLLLIHMHKIKNDQGQTGTKGASPFRQVLGWTENKGELKYPCVSNYDWITDDGYKNFASWIEKAAKQAVRD